MVLAGFFLQLAMLSTALAKIEIPSASIPGLRFDTFGYVCQVALMSSSYVTTSCVLGTEGTEDENYAEYYGCLCALKPYLISQLNCIVEAVEKTNTSRKAIADSWYGNEESCVYYKETFAYTFAEAWEELQANPVTMSWEESNATVSAPFLPDYTILDDNLLSVGHEYHFQHYNSELFGMITMWYFFGIILLQTILHWSQYWFPGAVRLLNNNAVTRQVRRWVVMPAMISKSRAQPIKFMRYFLLQFPPRLHTVLFAGYLFLSIFFLCFHYKVVLSPYFYATKSIYISVYVAWRSGELAMYKMPLVFLLGGRNNILIWMTGWQMEIFNHWHRWVARLFAIDVIIHSIAYTIYFVAAGEAVATEYQTENYLRWGAVATVAVSFLCVNGTKTLRELAYETFLYLHIVVAVFSVVGTYWHVKGFEGFNLIWPVIAFWGFDRLARLVRVIVSNPLAKAEIISHPNGVLEMNVRYSGLWKPKAGSYVFMHFLTGLYGFQSHPFTIVDGDRKGEFKLYTKVLKGVTRALETKAQKQGGRMNCRVLVEGPYGVEFATKMYQEVVLFAGGIGITAIYSHLKHIASQNVDKQIIHVHWAISTKYPLEWFAKELAYMSSFPNVDITIYHNNDTGVGALTASPDISAHSNKSAPVKDKDSVSSFSTANCTVQNARLTPIVDKVVADHCVNSQGPILFFVCGPDSMADSIRAGVSKHMLKTKNYVEYYEESFSM